MPNSSPLIILKCELIVDDQGWRIEYIQQGVKVTHWLTAENREQAVKEAIMQGFTKISVWRVEDDHMTNDGTVVVPKYTGDRNGRPY